MDRVGIHERGGAKVVQVRILVGGGVVAAPVKLPLGSEPQLRAGF